MTVSISHTYLAPSKVFSGNNPTHYQASVHQHGGRFLPQVGDFFRLWQPYAWIEPMTISQSIERQKHHLELSVKGMCQAKKGQLSQDELVCLDEVQKKRGEQGLPSLDVVSVTDEIESIADNTTLSDQEKRRSINDVRKKYQLSKGEMKKLFTKRLERISKDMTEMLTRHDSEIRDEQSRAVAQYGAGSPQAIWATQRADALQRVTQPMKESLEQKGKLYNSMYKPGGCVKKAFKGVGGFFKSVGKGLGQFGLGLLKTAVAPFKQLLDPRFWKGMLLPLALGFIPGVGPLVATAVQTWQKGVGFLQGLPGMVQEKSNAWMTENVPYYEAGRQRYEDGQRVVEGIKQTQRVE